MLEIINQKYMNVLFEIAKKPKNISELARKGDLTLSVASNLITRWARQGVVIKEKYGDKGREIIITLTEYGKMQTELLKSIKKNHQDKKKGEDTECGRCNGEGCVACDARKLKEGNETKNITEKEEKNG